MFRVLSVLIPILLACTLIRAAISQGMKIQAIMQGVEPQTDWILIGLTVVTVVAIAVGVMKSEDP